MGKRGPKPRFLDVACPNEACTQFELLGKETLLSMAPMREVPAKAGNLSAIHAKPRSVIEPTRRFMTCEQMKRKSRWL